MAIFSSSAKSAGQKLIEVIIAQGSISPTLTDFDVKVNEVNVQVATHITVLGTIEVADQKFKVPFRRVDTGREVPMVATVTGGNFKLDCFFPTEGKWEINSDLLNQELERPTFHVATTIFHVLN